MRPVPDVKHFAKDYFEATGDKGMLGELTRQHIVDARIIVFGERHETGNEQRMRLFLSKHMLKEDYFLVEGYPKLEPVKNQNERVVLPHMLKNDVHVLGWDDSVVYPMHLEYKSNVEKFLKEADEFVKTTHPLEEEKEFLKKMPNKEESTIFRRMRNFALVETVFEILQRDKRSDYKIFVACGARHIDPIVCTGLSSLLGRSQVLFLIPATVAGSELESLNEGKGWFEIADEA